MKRAMSAVPFLLVAVFCIAQTPTGIPPFSSTGGGPFDRVDLANLNVGFSVPITSKAGRGIPFSFAIGYNNSIWSNVTSGSLHSWQPLQMFGWQTLTDAKYGYVAHKSQTFKCRVFDPDTGLSGWSTYRYDYWGPYIDPNGTAHGGVVATTAGSTDCGVDPVDSGSSTSTDGSGYTVTINSGGTATVYTRSGMRIYPGEMPGDAGQLNDSNGNLLLTTVANGTTTFTDTMGATALTISGAAPSPVSYAFPNSSGGNSQITANYTSYTIQTNFQCSGVTEYTSSSTVPLITSIVLPDNSQYTFTYETTPGQGATHVTGRIASVTLPTGGTITYTYSGGNNGINCADGSAVTLSRALSGHVDVPGTWTYDRSTGPTIVTDAANNQTQIQFQGVYETERDVYSGSTTSGMLLQTTYTCYNGTAYPCNSISITLPITDITSTTKIGTFYRQTDTTLNSYGLQTAIKEYDFGSGSVGSKLRETDITYAQLNNNTILDCPSDIIVKDGTGTKFAEVQIAYDGNSLTPTSGAPQHDYSNYGSSFTARGNPTSMSQWVSGTTFITTTNTYDDLGNLRSTTDQGGHTTSFDYTDSYNDGVNRSTQAFATTTTLPQTGSVSHVVKNKFYWPAGMLYQATDQNNQTTTYSYDNMWRSAEVDNPDGGKTFFSYPNSQQVKVQQLISGTSCTGPNCTESWNEVDGFGRPSRTAKANGQSTPYDQTDTCYDPTTLKVTSAYAYQGSGVVSGANGTKHCSSSQGDVTAFDVLGRTTSVTHSDSTNVQTLYSGRAVEVKDEGNGSGVRVTHVYQQDGLGRTTSVCELAGSIFGIQTMPTCGTDLEGGSTGVSTVYSYDPLGNVRSITQGSLNQRQLAYDGVGHMIGEYIPESNNTDCSGSDGNAYSICFFYDSEGKLTSRKRLRPNQTVGGTALTTTSYTFDELHRLRVVNYDDTSTENTSAQVFLYDNGTLGVGHLTNAITENHALNTGYTFDNMGFDTMGRLNSDTQYVAVPTWVSLPFSYTYNLLGEVATANFSNFTLTNNYDYAGRLTQVTSSLNDAQHPPTLLSNVQYNQYGQVTGDSLGNGVNETFGFDTRRRLQSISAMKNATTIYSLGGPGTGNIMTYTPNSGLAATNDSVNGNWTYSYDALNRISGAIQQSGSMYPPSTGFGFDIDRNGNRWHQNPGAQLSFDQTTNHIASGSGVTYDAAGNVINDGTHNYTYDAEYRITQVDGGSTASYLYDAFGRRVQRTVSGNVWDEFFDLNGNSIMEYLDGGWHSSEIYAGGRHLGSYVAGSTYFSHQDWLGSERARSDSNGTKAGTCTGNPYGDNYTCTGSDPSPIHYAGLGFDYETGLSHTLFRYYNPRLGLWMTADPAGLDASVSSDPQSLNRYSYVTNDPINFIDPFGLNETKTLLVGNCIIEVTLGFKNGSDEAAGKESVLDAEILFCGGGGGGGVSGGGGSGGSNPANNNGNQPTKQPPSQKPYDPGTFLHPSKEACSRINKFAKVEAGITAVSGATAVLAPPTAPVTGIVAAATGLFAGGLEIYMAFACE